jgi:hypothetical protein
MIFRARATRGLRRPSLDARTMGKRQAARPATERKNEGLVEPRSGIDQPKLKNIQCPCFFA